MRGSAPPLEGLRGTLVTLLTLVRLESGSRIWQMCSFRISGASSSAVKTLTAEYAEDSRRAQRSHRGKQEQVQRTWHIPSWKGRTDPDGRAMVVNMFVHTAHHRAQCEVYMRVKGIKAPDYTF